MAVAASPQCDELVFDASNDLLLSDVVDAAGVAITGATVTVSVFDLDDLVTPLVGPFGMVDDGGGDYSQTFKPDAPSGFFVGQRVKVVYDFDGPSAGDDRIFNLFVLVVEG
jgi:hypothetical protein